GAGLVAEFGCTLPAILKQMPHGFREAGVSEHDGSPGGDADYGVEECDQTLMAVEKREVHGECRRLPNLHSGLRIFRETLAMRNVERSGFNQQTAGNALGSRFPHQLLLERIDRIRR